MTEVKTEQAENVENPTAPQAQEPVAIVLGEAVTNIPDDLYIPPEALEVCLDAFEGPLDLLLYLIKRQNLDILDIPISEITSQYMEYVDVMKELHLDLAAEYLVMAAMLAEIKSRMLLPRQKDEDGEEIDPRAELIRRLQEYERFKEAAESLDQLPRRERDTFAAQAKAVDMRAEAPPPDINMKELLLALKEVMQRIDLNSSHHVQREPLSIRERMSTILQSLENDNFVDFAAFFNPNEGRLGVVVTFIAILELLKGSMIEVVQADTFGPIHVRAVMI